MPQLTTAELVYQESIESILAWFAYEHLPDGLGRETSKSFHDTAHELASRIDRPTIELVYSLHALASAKDWAVRAALATQRRDEERALASLAPEDDTPQIESNLAGAAAVKHRQGRYS